MLLKGLPRGVPTALRCCGSALLLLLLLPALRGEAAENPLVSGQLLVQGTRLTLYADDLTTDADQTINIGERARVRTCFGGVEDACGTVLPGDPRIAGLAVRGELIGPEAPAGVPLETVPGGSFVLPGLQQEGDYRLENIRLVETATGRVLGAAEPSVAFLHVRQILLTSATVRTLSLAELRERGIALSQENFQAFSFAVGFAFGSETVEIELPLLFDGFGSLAELEKPRVNLDGLPSHLVHEVSRWQPPTIVPFVLERDEREVPKLQQEEEEDLRLPIFGAIVVPGTVTYLNQFFEARVIVANGAPVGSGVRLTDLGGLLRLPSGNVLRAVGSNPSVMPGQRVPLMDAGGSRTLDPGEQGNAAWTVEGLAPGSHALAIDVTGEIERPGRQPLPVLSRVQAAVEVVDARFNLTFSHPDTVREGEGYSLFVTVTNLSRVTQNLVTVELAEANLVGVHKADPADTLQRTIESLAPGQGETLEYRLVSDLDGKVVATTFQSSSSAGQGTIRLRAGVGELGIPLSPATLVLPRFSERLRSPHLPDDDFYRANVRFLGLAYSLAVAPPAHVPPELPRVIRSDVERRAIDFAQAGHRTFLGEPLLEALEILALDQLGNRHPLAEIDELRRRLSKGEDVAAALAGLFRREQQGRGLGAVALLDHLARTASYSASWMGAVVVPEGTAPLPTLEIRRPTEEGLGVLARPAGAVGTWRTLPFGEVYGVREHSAGGAEVPLALVGHVERDELFEVVLRNETAQPAVGRLVLVLPDAHDPRELRRVDLGTVEVPVGGALAVVAGAPVPAPLAGGFGLYHLGTGIEAGGAASQSHVGRPPFRLIGAVQDFRIAERPPDRFGNIQRPNRYGNGIVYLFNRPPDETAAEQAASYSIRSTFEGLDTAGQPAAGASEKVGSAAWVQDDPRVVAVRYSTPISALVDPATGGPLLAHEHLLDAAALVDGWGQPLSSELPAPVLETDPFHVGGLVGGRVLRGTGEPAAGARVKLARLWSKETPLGTVVVPEILGEVTTAADGRFFFDFVETPHWDRKVEDSFVLRATVPAGADPDLEPADVIEVRSRIRLQNRLAHVNIALLGRGAVTGRLVYLDNGAPVPGGQVTGASTLFNELRSVQVAADGSFRLGGLPVGPITLTGRDADGRRVYATVGIEQPGATVDVELRIPRAPPPGSGTVAGRVVRATNGDPVAGARVAVYSAGHALGERTTDTFGRFRFDDVPEGQVSLQAAAWEVSRSAVFTDLVLAAGQTAEVTLRLPDGASRTVTGSVFFHDPLTNTPIPVAGAAVFVPGPGVFTTTDAAGGYRIEGLPVQGVSDPVYRVHAIDYGRKLEGSVPLPPVVDASPEVIEAQSIVLRSMEGAIDGVVLDPLGRPMGGVEVLLFPVQSTTSGPDGSFSFSGVPVGSHTVLAHFGDGLQPGREGYFGSTATQVVFGGHRPFVGVRMVGSGVVTVKTRTQTSTGVLTPLFYKPTWFHEASWSIKLRGSYFEASTDPNGDLELALPVGEYELVAYNPFHGIKTVKGRIDFAGQSRHHEIVFEDAATVAGQVVDVDGHTPVPDIEVTLTAKGLLPQKQRTDAQGNFRFELVPKGQVVVVAAGLVGTVERVGRTVGSVNLGGQVLDVVVQMKAQGSVRGRVMERFNDELRPLPFAQYYVREDAWPYRRLPAGGGFYVTDAEGRYEVSHLYAGGVTVVARDSQQVSRSGSVRGTIAVDWEVVELPDVVMTTSVGTLRVVVRDPQTGGPVPDAQVRLSNGEATVSGPDGLAVFDALPLGGYSVYAFHAPTGRSGRLGGLQVSSPGQEVGGTVLLDQRGEVRGTLYDDPSRIVPVPGATVRLIGNTAGGRVTALATTEGTEGEEGRFSFLGIPEGTFSLEAALQTSPRRARAEATLTDTSPVADVVMVLEPVGDVYVRLYEKLTAGLSPADPAASVFSVRFSQSGYDFTRAEPEAGTDVFFFPELLLSRAAKLAAQELSGEQRAASASFLDFLRPPPLAGSGSAGDPYQLVLRPKGVVEVTVVDGAGAPAAGANVTLNASGVRFPSVTGADGRVVFAAVPSGSLIASASSPITGAGGRATGTLTFDDEVVSLAVQLAPAVAAHGVVFQPVLDDRWSGDPADLLPAADILVEIRDSKNVTQLVVTGADGAYRFDVLPTGSYTVTARSSNGDQVAAVAGTLVGPDGFDNPVPALLLDAAPPRIVSIVPPPGLEGVSRTATVEIVFSEPLHSAVLPTGQSSSSFFRLSPAGGGLAAGSWTSHLDPAGFQVVRFTASTPYANFTTYSLTITGGPNGVRDRAARPLTASGNVGSNFKTSDAVGPEVIATLPELDRPVDPGLPIRFDFNEAVVATDEQLDGDGVGDAAELYGLGEGGSEVRLPVTTFLTRSGFSLSVQAVEGVTFAGDTRHRRIVVSGLADAHGNPMPPYERTFRLYDSNPPAIDAVPFPAGAPAGDLVQGVDYVLVPVLSGLDDVTAEAPGGDLARVDYFFTDPTDPAAPVSPSFSAGAHPFAFPFVGAYSGDGVTPRPFPVWAQAVDTSTNASNVVRVDMRVLPNTGPSVGSATLTALVPVAGTFYAGSTLRATVGGFDDPDGSQLTLSVELRADGSAEAIARPADRLVTRPAEGWPAAPAQTYDLALPLDLAEGTGLYLLARAIDSQGAVGELESERHPVADDATAPVIEALAAKLADGRPETLFLIGESFYFELQARDDETAVESVTIELDRTDLFPDPLVFSPVAGSPGLYRTAAVPVPGELVTERTDVVATVRVHDHGGNVAEEALAFAVAPQADPTAPVARWLAPSHGFPWPADHSSVISADGAALLLWVEATDLSADATGELFPGTIVAVRFRGPSRDAETGEVVSSDQWVDGELVAGTGAPGRGQYRALWRVPNGVAAGSELRFDVQVVDGGGTATIESVALAAAASRRVYEGVTTAVAPEDPMLAAGADETGAVFLLDGTTLSLRPQEDGSVRSLPAVHLYAGGEIVGGALVVRPSVLTAPEITTYDSAILFHPLELALDTALTVGLGSRVDMSRKGLLGNTPTRSMILQGETKPGQWAGGSHGGRGGYGSPSSGWDKTNLTEPGSVYDSLRDPKLPGGGGTSSTETPGGAGGGVVRLLAPGAAVRLDGDVLADGGQGSGGGGAGGAIRLVAGELDGRGRLSAAGGAGSFRTQTGGGGGGRIAVSHGALAPEVDLVAQANVAGGHNDWQTPSAAQRRGGAGTLYLEPLDDAGQPAGPGRVHVVNPSDLVAATTPLPAVGSGTLVAVDAVTGEVELVAPAARGEVVGDTLVATGDDGITVGSFPIVAQSRVGDGAGGFRTRLELDAPAEALEPLAAELAAGRPVRVHGRSRLETVAASGRVRWLADDDLLLGPADDPAPTLNDRSRLELFGPARAMLRDEGPSVDFTADPAVGAELLLGSTLTLSWQARDPLGLRTTVTEWSLGTGSVEAFHAGEPLEVAGPQVSLPIAADAEPGPVSYRVVATDVGGREVVAEVAWTVLPNEPPSATLSLGPEAVLPAAGGFQIPVVVQAADREGLASVTLLASGPAVSTSQTVAASGKAFEALFTVEVLAAADGTEPIILQAVVEDFSGASTTTGALEIPIVGDALAPTVTLTLSPDSATYTSGDTVTILASAEDDVGVETLTLTVDGVSHVTVESSLSLPWTVPPVDDVTVVTLSAEAFDPSGNRGSASREVTVGPRLDDVLPGIAFTCPTTGAVLPVGHELSLTVRATDDLGIAWVDFFVVGDSEPFARVAPASGTPVTFDATTTYRLPETAGEVRLRAEAVDAGNNRRPAEIAISAVETVDLFADGAGTNEWTALGGKVAVLRSGTLTLDQPVGLGGLIVLPGAVLTHQVTPSGAERSLSAEVAGSAYVACGAAIDVSGRGFAANVTYPGHGLPGHVSGGSRIGVGGVTGLPAGESFGSVVYPREPGGGGNSGGAGGGVIRIVADRLQVDGAVRANGTASNQAGAGGSVWVTAQTIAGSGTIQALGATASSSAYGSGGGGAVAVAYAAVEAGSTVLETLSARGGTQRSGGAGSVNLLGPGSTFGSLILDNAAVAGVTHLPALGAGVAETGSAGPVLVTDRAVAIPAYFLGHWVEIYDGASGQLEATARVAAVDGVTVTLDSPVDIAPGDLWQGVYRFDRLDISSGVTLVSGDPIRVENEATFAGTTVADVIEASSVVVESGTLTVREVRADVLRVTSGATLTHRATTDPTRPERLAIEVGELVVEEGAAIDVSGRGFATSVTYPGHGLPGHASGGSHIGRGGLSSLPPGESFGSVTRPQEPGGGGRNTGGVGGGVVRIVADRLQVDGAVRANGTASNSGGAGGSVWVTAETIAGSGTIQAVGATASFGSGGGGAVAVAYAAVEAGSTVLETLSARGGTLSRSGGAGSVYLLGPSSTYGSLTLDNSAVAGVTHLPALGAGVAETGSAGSVLVTDRAVAIPAYFVGHWVEVYDGATGQLEATARVAAVDGVTVMLDSPVDVAPGDLWQGVYRFDRLDVPSGITLVHGDPIRGADVALAGTVQVDVVEGRSVVVEPGTLTVGEVRADVMRLAPGATLTHRATTDPTRPERLSIEVGELVVEEGAAIDVSGRGFALDTTYPGHAIPGNSSGGSHIGVGGVSTLPAGASFGSVERPQEPGGGGRFGGSGGGVVRIVADRLQVDGAVRANGTTTTRGGAGGSIWVTAEAVAGNGTIQAVGASASSSSGGAGGGGAVAIDYGVVETGSTLLETLLARGGTTGRIGGAGSIHLFGPESTYGSLTLDNTGFSGITDLPALGSGVAQPDSAGPVLVTDRPVAIHEYFLGHWVRVMTPDGLVRGTWRIGALDGAVITLLSNGGESAVVEPSDEWSGIYRFDTVEVTGGAVLQSSDPVEEHSAAGFSAAGSRANPDAPQWNPAAVDVTAGPAAGRVEVRITPAALADADGIAEVRLGNGVRWLSRPWDPLDGASFVWEGEPAEYLTLVAIDAHGTVRRATPLRLAAPPELRRAVPGWDLVPASPARGGPPPISEQLP